MVVVLDGLLVQPQRGLGVAAAVIGRHQVRIEANRPIRVADRFLVELQSRAQAGPLEIQVGIAGVEADRLGAIGNDLLAPLEVVVGCASGRSARVAEAPR